MSVEEKLYFSEHETRYCCQKTSEIKVSKFLHILKTLMFFEIFEVVFGLDVYVLQKQGNDNLCCTWKT